VEEESNFTSNDICYLSYSHHVINLYFCIVESVEQSCPIISILKDSNLYESWSYFVQTVLSQYLDKQVTSSADILTGHVSITDYLNIFRRFLVCFITGL
jgi:hypothetical protein